MVKNYLGTRLRELRESQGLLLRQIAAKIDVDTALMSKLERGERKIQRDQLARIASVLKIRQEDLTILWLADKITDVIEDEPMAEQALKLIKKDINKI